MNKQYLVVSAGMIICLLLLTSVALAMSSDNYGLDEHTQLTGGGGRTSSAHYAVNFTAGQTVIGAQSKANHEGCLGYWCGVSPGYVIRLPLVQNDSSP